MRVGWTLAAVTAVVVLGVSAADVATTPPATRTPPAPRPAATAEPATPARSASVAAPAAGYPNAASTGVPAGVVLRVVHGDVTTSTNGQLVQGLDVTGTLVVRNDGVTVRNSRIRGRVDYRSTSGGTLTIENAE